MTPQLALTHENELVEEFGTEEDLYEVDEIDEFGNPNLEFEKIRTHEKLVQEAVG